MPPSAIRRILLPALLGVALGIFQATIGRALESRTFIIAATTGYGAEECLGEGGECGRLVADAWCNAHGEGVALKFGQSEGDAGAASNVSWAAQKEYYITCSN
jgi:hypothetical protein